MLLFMLLLFSVSAFAHPGKTDRRGGHKCWKNCGGWELHYGEYHLHDKNWRPIRLNERGEPIQPPQLDASPSPETQEPTNPMKPAEENRMVPSEEKIPDGKNADSPSVVKDTETLIIYEESILSLYSMLLLALAILLVVVLVIMRKKREKE